MSVKFILQRLSSGWSDNETWSLDSSLSKIILPRLKRFKELTNGHPCDLTKDEWHKMLDEMIFAFEWFSSDKRFACDENSEVKEERAKQGVKLFGERFTSLWW